MHIFALEKPSLAMLLKSAQAILKEIVDGVNDSMQGYDKFQSNLRKFCINRCLSFSIVECT